MAKKTAKSKPESKGLKKIKVYYSIQNMGDGSADNYWFLTSKDAEKDQDMLGEWGDGWGESCYGSVETFEGSDIHKEAKKRSAILAKRIEAHERGERSSDYDYDI